MRMRIFFKLAVLGFLSLLLLIALGSISGVTREREGRLAEVQHDIAASYAGPQRILGPFAVLKFRETWSEKKYNSEKDLWYEEEQSSLRTEAVCPNILKYEASLDVEERYRGIFKAHVFQSHGKLSGEITLPELNELRKYDGSSLELISTCVSVIVSDPRGISRVSDLRWGDTDLKILPGAAFSGKVEGFHAEVPALADIHGTTVSFSMDMGLYGTESLKFVPIGANNQIDLASSWPHPSFTGDFLPVNRTISDEGFSAKWEVNELASSARQDLESGRTGDIQYSGVTLIDPVNPYPLTDRALKYGFLFIFITFAAFFLFELIRQLRIHPIQYGFVGLAQAIFFLLLLSLSEHIGFGWAYCAASVVTVGLITFYLCAILKGVGRGLIFGGLLAFLYAVLYGLLQSEDHALVSGSVLLFGLLALVMVVTRKIDWYALSEDNTRK